MRVVAIVEVVVSVKCAVAKELKEIAMKAVGAGLADDVDDVAAAPSILRGEGVGLDLELLDAFNGGNVDDAAPVLRSVPGSIEKIGRSAEVSSAEVEKRNVLVGAARDAVGVDHLGLRRVVDRGVQRREAEDIAEIQGEFDNLFLRDVRGDVGIVGIEQRRSFVMTTTSWDTAPTEMTMS